MRELLIRYLLGELEPEEHDRVHRQLAASPELRSELAQLRECFAASLREEESEAEPPRGLAQRATANTSLFDSNEALMAAQQARVTADATEPPAGALGWSLADLAVAGGVMLAVSMLLFPALRDSRDGTRRTVCQNHMRQLWFVVSKYSEMNRNYLPEVEPDENAGIFAVKLLDRNCIDEEDLKVLLVCPGAPLADEIRAKRYAILVPTLEELKKMTPDELAAARRHMSPMIAYRLGYFVGPNYYYVRNEPVPHSPLFADAPGSAEDGFISPNHGGSIMQVLHADGNVRVLTSCTIPGVGDDLFHNTRGQMKAGVGRQDSVLGVSECTPGTEPVAVNR
jgi:hypothetical protein